MAAAASAASAGTGDAKVVAEVQTQYTEFQRFAAFDETAKVLFSTFAMNPAEITGMLEIWRNEADAIAHGVAIDAVHFDVHRFYDTQGLIYGRQTGDTDGPGFGLCKVETGGGKYVVAVATFEFPMVSARAIPMLKEFCTKKSARESTTSASPPFSSLLAAPCAAPARAATCTACAQRAMAAAPAAGAKDKGRERKNILDLSKYIDKAIIVKFNGGRQVTGVLKGYDNLFNLVLDDTTEQLRDPDDPDVLTNEGRKMGVVVCRGTQVVLICPVAGMEEIANPFAEMDR